MQISASDVEAPHWAERDEASHRLHQTATSPLRRRQPRPVAMAAVAALAVAFLPSPAAKLLCPASRVGVAPPPRARPLVGLRAAPPRYRLSTAARSASSTPKEIAEKVTESIKHAEEACAEDPVGGECVAAWDEVEELSAAASHARDRQRDADPLEAYCKDNPETDECRTYED